MHTTIHPVTVRLSAGLNRAEVGRGGRVNYGKMFEDIVEKSIQRIGKPYTRENVARFGIRASKGKFDFKIIGEPSICFDCKSVATNNNLTMPPMKTPKVKTHQLRELRKEHALGNASGLLIEYRNIEKVYWLSIGGLNAIHGEYGAIKAITPTHCERYGKVIEFKDGTYMLEQITE